MNAVNNQGTAVGTYLGVCGATACTSEPQIWTFQQSSGALNELTLDSSETGTRVETNPRLRRILRCPRRRLLLMPLSIPDIVRSAALLRPRSSRIRTTDAGPIHAFLYENGQIYDLNSLIDPSDPLAGIVSLQGAVSINSNGWIAVNGTDSRYSGLAADRAFLLIPSQ